MTVQGGVALGWDGLGEGMGGDASRGVAVPLAAQSAFQLVVKTRSQLMDAAYHEDVFVDDRTIDSHIKRLRRKFRAVADDFAAIETLYGAGYSYGDA